MNSVLNEQNSIDKKLAELQNQIDELKKKVSEHAEILFKNDLYSMSKAMTELTNNVQSLITQTNSIQTGHEYKRICKTPKVMTFVGFSEYYEKKTGYRIGKQLSIASIFTEFLALYVIENCGKGKSRKYTITERGKKYLVFPNNTNDTYTASPLILEDKADELVMLIREMRGETILRCESCGMPISRAQHETSMMFSGKHLCNDCFKKENRT